MNIIGKHIDMPIAAFGDIHGIFDVIRSKAKIYFLENIVCFACGDFGVGFCYNDPREPRKEKKRLSDLNLFLKKRNIFLYVVRGNHDNPLFFDGNHNFSNLIFMQDYDVVEIGEHHILGIGGATSVDRKENPNFGSKGRREGIDWWPDEKVVYNEEKLQSLGGIDMVVSHTCPDFIYPAVKNEDVERWIEYDPELRQDLENERQTVTNIYNELSKWNFIRFWCYGHFHQTYTQKHELTTFCLLDINELREVRWPEQEED